jgi:hypothetical protein
MVPLFRSAGVYSASAGLLIPLFIVLTSSSGKSISTMTAGTYKINGKQTDNGIGALISSGWAIQDIVVHLEGGVELFELVSARWGTGSKDTLLQRRPVPKFKQRQLDCIHSNTDRVVIDQGGDVKRYSKTSKKTTTRVEKKKD